MDHDDARNPLGAIVKIHNPNNLPTIDIRTINDFQGNLKDLDGTNHDKVLAVLTKRGFIVPLFVWKNPSDGQFYMMDGHQRKRVIEHNELPSTVPYIEIPAKNEREAKEILLEITSQYGTMTPDGLDEYTELAELTVAELDVNFDAINLQKLWEDIAEAETAAEAARAEKRDNSDRETRWSLDQLHSLAVRFSEENDSNSLAEFLIWLEKQ